MTGKAKIKVIKKNKAEEAKKPVVIEKKAKQEAVRQMVSNVTNWVSDFQHRKREETKIAIEKFFNQQPQTNGV